MNSSTQTLSQATALCTFQRRSGYDASAYDEPPEQCTDGVNCAYPMSAVQYNPPDKAENRPHQVVILQQISQDCLFFSAMKLDLWQKLSSLSFLVFSDNFFSIFT